MAIGGWNEQEGGRPHAPAPPIRPVRLKGDARESKTDMAVYFFDGYETARFHTYETTGGFIGWFHRAVS